VDAFLKREIAFPDIAARQRRAAGAPQRPREQRRRDLAADAAARSAARREVAALQPARRVS